MNEDDAKNLVAEFFSALYRKDDLYLRNIFDRSRVDLEDFYRTMKEFNLSPGKVDNSFIKEIDLKRYDPDVASGWYAIAPFINGDGTRTDFSVEFSINDDCNTIEVDDFRVL